MGIDKARVVALFLGVARAGSFSRAAGEAGLTPQAVSKAVRQLESHLGLRLLHRTTRSLSLTEEGQRLVQLASPGLRLLDEALDQVQNSKQEIDGLIRLAAPTSIGNRLLVPLMHAFQLRYPGVVFDLLLDDHFTDLVEARIDVGFRAGNPPQRNLIARRMADIALLVCAAPDYLARHGAPRDVADLARHRCTGFRQPNTGRLVPWELQVDGSTLYQDVPAVASFNTVEAEVGAVLAGMGIGQLSDYMVDAELASGALVPLLPDTATYRLGLYMYYPQRTQLPLRVRNFIDFVVATGLRPERAPRAGAPAGTLAKAKKHH